MKWVKRGRKLSDESPLEGRFLCLIHGGELELLTLSVDGLRAGSDTANRCLPHNVAGREKPGLVL